MTRENREFERKRKEVCEFLRKFGLDPKVVTKFTVDADVPWITYEGIAFLEDSK